MKLLIASDIHGSEYYAREIERVYKEEKPRYLILLGDLLYHGARNNLPKEYNPKGVIEILNKYKDRIIAVRGNCDSEVDQMVLDFDSTIVAQ
ncbi:MAG: phosphodiesterase [Andreesenia angusta]|nr:phosphodiesterase [Andreesenia angusta]